MTKKLTVGILAHVDAGKTTLSEALLYKAGAIRSQGRVDKGDAFLDNDSRERARGITIFSKEARLHVGETQITLLDTPGHVDFATEMERTLFVLDYAILLISGKEVVQGHTITLWSLLKKYEIPTFVFVNKMDLDGADEERILDELNENLDDGFISFSAGRDQEEIAMCDEELLSVFLEKGILSAKEIAAGISRRKLFPCFFGSALKMEGIDSFLAALDELTLELPCEESFGARVYKITRDSQGKRLTHMKIIGGQLKVKDSLNDEKVDQIRLYSGEKYQAVDGAEAGTICAVVGLSLTEAGQGLGFETGLEQIGLSPVMTYSLVLPEGQDEHTAYNLLKQLEEEDPQLHIIWNSQFKTVEMKLMGQIQLEILTDLIKERFDIEAGFDSGRIAYKETIAAPVKCGGHFEPLRHYAEVHLLLEPGAPGSGLVFDSTCSEDILDKNWQKLIFTHLAEKDHAGVLTGSPITDVKITIIAGRAHVKHTSGGDFRQATYRALRQGLRKADNILLEPWYEFRLEVPEDTIGRAMADIQRMGGSFDPPKSQSGRAVIKGRAPVSEMKDYGIQVSSYTRGYGSLACLVCGYEPCHNAADVIEAIGYDPDRDVENTGDSVFCDHEAGGNVKWDEADSHFHIQINDDIKNTAADSKERSRDKRIEEKELQRIFERTYGKPKERKYIPPKTIDAEEAIVPQKIKHAEILQEYLLVDGYNIIFAWDELKELAKASFDGAREALIEILENYQGYKKSNVIVVFDAYKVKGGEEHTEKRGGIGVVFTRESETADTYIERATYKLGKKYRVRVATSDHLEQMIIIGNGGMKISAEEFKHEIEQVNREISDFFKEQ